MKYFFLDTSNSNLILAIYKNKTCLAYYNKPCDNSLSSEVMVIIDKLFKQARVNPCDINKIFVAIGPGSFTGIRIGVTIAKIYAWTFNIKIVPVSSLEVLATTRFRGYAIVPLIDARRGYVYAGVYDKHLNIKNSDCYISLEKIKLDNKKCVVCSYDNFDGLKVIKPNVQLIKVIKKHEKDLPIDPHMINPSYLKLTEAEEKFQNE